MNVIVFASRKGGSGKSTLAAHLAAHVHKSTKPCLLIDADPQGSLTLWHKLRGTNEPPIKSAVNSVSGIIAAAKRDGMEWVFIDTPPNISAVVDDAIRNATMVIIPARPGVFDVNAVQETIQTCRSARKPYAVVVNGAPAERDGVESRIVTIAREALAKFRAPVWSVQITNQMPTPHRMSWVLKPCSRAMVFLYSKCTTRPRVFRCCGVHRYAVSFKNPVSISLAFDRFCYRRLTTAGSWLMAGECEAATSSEGPSVTLKFY